MVSDVEVTWRFESNSVGMGAGAAPERNPPRARACASCGAGGAPNLPLNSFHRLLNVCAPPFAHKWPLGSYTRRIYGAHLFSKKVRAFDKQRCPSE